MYDLGAGLGTIAFEAAYSGAKIYAIEIDPIKVACMNILLRYNNLMAKAQLHAPQTPGLKRTQLLDVEIKRMNITKTNLRDADVVYCYLSPTLMPMVKEKAIAEMKQGKKIISVEYPIKEWNPTYVDKQDKIYVYTIGET